MHTSSGSGSPVFPALKLMTRALLPGAGTRGTRMASGALACDTTGRIPVCEAGTAGRNTAPSPGSPADSDWDAPSSGTAGPIAAWEPGTAGRNTAPCETLAFSVADVMFTEDSASAACLAALTRLCLAYLFFNQTGQVGLRTNACNSATAVPSSRCIGSAASVRKGRCRRKHRRAMAPASLRRASKRKNGFSFTIVLLVRKCNDFPRRSMRLMN